MVPSALCSERRITHRQCFFTAKRMIEWMELNLSHRTHWEVRLIRVATKRKDKDQSDDSRRDVRLLSMMNGRVFKRSQCSIPSTKIQMCTTVDQRHDHRSHDSRDLIDFHPFNNFRRKILRMKLMFFFTRFIEELTFLFDHYKLKDTVRSFIHRLIPLVRRDGKRELCMPVTRMRTFWRWCSSRATRMLIRQ